MGVLFDPREERFVQYIVEGIPHEDAKIKAGYKKGVSIKRLLARPQIHARLEEIMARSAARAELTRADILEGIKTDWQQARRLGQMSAALKAAEMLGKEMHKMFVDRKEIGAPGDFENKSEEEIIRFISETLKSLGINQGDTVSIVELSKEDNTRHLLGVIPTLPKPKLDS